MSTQTPQPAAPTAAPTPRETRHRLNRIESWFRKHRHEFRLGRQGQIDALLDVAVTAEHADTLAHYVRRWLDESRRIDALVETDAAAEDAALRSLREAAADEREAAAERGDAETPEPEPAPSPAPPVADLFADTAPTSRG